MLSLLIYNAQCYRRHDALIDAGWTPGEPAILERAFKRGRKLEYLGENTIEAAQCPGSSADKLCALLNTSSRVEVD